MHRLPYHINSISSVLRSIVFDSQRPGSIHHVSVCEVDIEGEGADIYLVNLTTSSYDHAKVCSLKLQ